MNSLLASQFFCDVFDILSESSSHILSVALKTYSPRTKAIDLCYPPQQGDIGSEIKKVQQAPFCTLRSFTIMDNDEDWFSDNARNLSTLFSKVLRLFCKNRTRLNLHLHTSNCLVCVDTVLPRLYTYFFSLSITYAGQPSQEFLNKAVVHGHLQELYLVNEYCTEKWPTTTTKTLETLVKQLQWTKIVLDYNTEFSTFECFSDLFEQWHLGPQNMAMTASGRREFTFYAKFPVKEFAKHVDIAPDNAWENKCSVESSALSSTLSGGEPLGSEFLQTLETMRVIQALGQGSATDEVKEWARQRVESYTRGLPESELAVIRKNAEKIKNTMRMEQERGRPPPEPIEIPHFDEKSAKKWIYDRKRECMAVYEYASAEKSSNVFSKVVTEKKAPGYNEFIRQPQDLTSIKKLIAGKQVLDRNEIKKRIMLMYANCVMYNEEGDEYWLIAERSAKYFVKQGAYLFPPECVSCQLQRRVTETNDQIILNCNSTDDSASFGCYFREKSDWIEQVCVCNGDGCNKEIPSLDTLMNSVKVLVNWGQNVFKYDEVTVVLIASFLGACLLQEQLIPVIYRALKSWSLCPLYCNWKISRTITQDVRKYMLSHDIPPLDQRDVHALGDSLWESISRKSGSSFRSYEDRTYRFEREVREEITRNDLLCRRAGYLRQCQNRMMMNDMTRIRCTDQLIKNLQQGIPPTAPIPDHAKKRSEQRKVDEDKPMAITQSSSIIRPNTAKMASTKALEAKKLNSSQPAGMITTDMKSDKTQSSTLIPRSMRSRRK